MKRLLKIMLVLTLTVSIFAVKGTVYAADDSGTEWMELRFQNFSYHTEVPEGAYALYQESDEEETYLIYSEAGELLNEVSVSYPTFSTNAANSDVYTSFFTEKYSKTFGDNYYVKLLFTACVQYYSSGSFRSFESLNYTHVGVDTAYPSMEAYNCTSSAWPHTGRYPCTRLDFAYSTSVRTTGTVSASVGNILGGFGFTGTSGIYKYGTISHNGYFELYNR